MSRLALLSIAAALVVSPVARPAGGQSAAADAACPSETIGQEMDGLLFCIPQANERYRLTFKGAEPMYWLGDAPVPPPQADPARDDDVTIARVWADPDAVGMSDQASGTRGFDRFLELIATSILKAASQAGGADEFPADVPIDESGRLQPFHFQRQESGVLKGVRQEPDQSGSYMILMRPADMGQPHLMLCGIVGVGGNPAHLCISFIALFEQRMAITIAGRNLDRSFRISEEIVRDLSAFAVPPAGAP